MNFQELKLLGLSMLAVALITGCASAKKGGEMAKEAAQPAAAPQKKMAAAGGDQGAMADDVHVVQAGECLWCISALEKIYGDPYQWPIIYKYNQHQIKDADLIYPGQELIIKRGLGAAEIDRAVHHARYRGAWGLGVIEDSDIAYKEAEKNQ